MAINKVVYGATTLIDITDTTATESDVAEGKVFYKADGTRSVGTMSGGGFSPVLLWTNGSPNANFGAQTVSLDLSGYEWIMVDFLNSKSATPDTQPRNVDFFQVGSTGRLRAVIDAVARRQLSISTTGITFAQAYNLGSSASSFTAANSVLIPYKIYGII